jgi:hypothetical protein
VANSSTRFPWLAAFGSLLIGLAFLLYEPTRHRPFEILDFSEFLPILQAYNTWTQRFLALVRYYVHDQGRTNLLPYAAIALKWELFGGNVVAWQVARFLQMLTITAVVYHLCRRMGAGRAGAGWASALLITAGSASDAWLRLTMGEPLGLMFLLLAMELAVPYQESPSWRGRANGIAFSLGAMVLCKETLVATIPCVLAIAACRQRDGAYERAGWSPRAVGLAVRILAVMVVLGGLIVGVTTTAAGEAFASQYGSVSPSAPAALITFVLFLLPSRIGLEPDVVSLPANLAFLALVGTGWVVRLRSRDAGSGTPIMIAGLLLMPLAGAVVYAPWPMRELFYGLPFMVGPVLLLALAVTYLGRRGRAAEAVAQGLCAAILVLTALQARHLSAFRTARQEVNYELVRTLSALSAQDSAFVALQSTFVEVWRGPGPALMRYGRLLTPRGSMPAVINVRCEELPVILAAASSLAVRAVVSYSNTCGPLPHPTRRISRAFRYYDPSAWSFRTTGLQADITILPAARLHRVTGWSSSSRSSLDQ